jgi:hypothetical protein
MIINNLFYCFFFVFAVRYFRGFDFFARVFLFPNATANGPAVNAHRAGYGGICYNHNIRRVFPGLLL